MVQPLPVVAGLDPNAPIRPAAALSDELAELLAPRVRRLGYLGGFFAVAARQPKALVAFFQFTEALKETVPSDLTELVALRISAVTVNDYEHSQHVALATVQGRPEQWIRDVTLGRVESTELTDGQRDALNLVDAMLESQTPDVSGELKRVIDAYGEDLAVGLVLLISRYVAHSHASNAFGLVSPHLTRSNSKDD